LDHLELHSNGEYYLTDLVEVAVRGGHPVGTVQAPLEENKGGNDRVALGGAAAALRWCRLPELVLRSGTVPGPAATCFRDSHQRRSGYHPAARNNVARRHGHWRALRDRPKQRHPG